MSGFNTTHPASPPHYGLSYQSGGTLSDVEIREAEENRVAGIVRSQCERWVGSIPSEHRQDVVQNVTFAIMQEIRDGATLSDEKIPGYVFVAMRNAWNNMRRDEECRLKYESLAAHLDAAETSSWDETMHRAEMEPLKRAYEKALRGLSQECRISFEMIQLHRYSVAEVSKATGVKETTLRKRVAAAQRHLRKHFGGAAAINKEGDAT
jgi:RNA polymerase sigma factor (sigma-70 family)